MRLFKNLPKKHEQHQEAKPAMDIPNLMPQKIGTKKLRKLSLRATVIIYSILFVVLLGGIFTALYAVSSWFDEHQLVFQQPVFVKVQTPIYVAKRFVLAPIPHAEYIDVDPLTNPADIDAIIKGHESFNPIETTSLDPISKQTIEALVHNKVVQKYGEAAWPQIKYIIEHESGFDPYIVNKSSGACGLAQALPCSKLPSLDLTDQIYWLMNVYIPGHYNGSVKAAYDHKVATGWY